MAHREDSGEAEGPMKTMKIAAVISALYVVATGYGVYKALTWKPWL